MANKQEFPLNFRSPKTNNNNNENFYDNDSNKFYSNNPYLNYKSYKGDTNIQLDSQNHPLNTPLTKTVDLSNKLNIMSYGPQYENKTQNYQSYKWNQDFNQQEDIHGSFQFSQFLNDPISSEEIRTQTNFYRKNDFFIAHDLQNYQTRLRTPTHTNYSQIIQKTHENNIKFVAKVLETQLLFIKTLEGSKRELDVYFHGDYDKLCAFLMKDDKTLDFNSFSLVFQKLGVKADLDDLKLVFWRYSIEKIGVDRETFKKYFKPFDQAIEKENKSCGRITNNKLDNEIEVCSKVLKMNLNFEYSLELVRKEVKKRNIRLKEIFDEISCGENFITPYKLKKFLNVCSINVSDREAQMVFLLYDPYGNNLTFEKFYHEMLPKL